VGVAAGVAAAGVEPHEEEVVTALQFVVLQRVGGVPPVDGPFPTSTAKLGRPFWYRPDWQSSRLSGRLLYVEFEPYR
jgi:hypothetical protein